MGTRTICTHYSNPPAAGALPQGILIARAASVEETMRLSTSFHACFRERLPDTQVSCVIIHTFKNEIGDVF